MAKKNKHRSATAGGWYYILKSEIKPGVYKPGITSNPSKRFAQHGGEELWEQIDLAELGPHRAFKFERQVLKHFSGNRLNPAGEYLTLDSEELEELQEMLNQERESVADELEARAQALREGVQRQEETQPLDETEEEEEGDWLCVYRSTHDPRLVSIHCAPNPDAARPHAKQIARLCLEGALFDAGSFKQQLLREFDGQRLTRDSNWLQLDRDGAARLFQAIQKKASGLEEERAQVKARNRRRAALKTKSKTRNGIEALREQGGQLRRHFEDLDLARLRAVRDALRAERQELELRLEARESALRFQQALQATLDFQAAAEPQLACA